MVSKDNKNGHRPDWDTYFMNITREVSKRSNCMCMRIGATIVKNGIILSTGYTGAPRKTLDCYARGSCLRRELGIPSGHRYELCRSVHAEQNAIINAARQGMSVVGADIYLYGERIHGGESKLITLLPCFICKKMIINSGIRDVVYMDENRKVHRASVEGWQKRWQTHDMTQDMEKYDAKYEKKR
jgi:dCMP deaminase